MPLSSQRQRFSIFVSPRNEDFLFYEKVDKQRVREEIPEYGDPHPDYRKYPNHFFAQAVQADEEGQVYYYYYAAKRENQDDYNWEHTTVDHKQLTYDQVERTYVTLRSEYDEDSPALGSAMPLTDSDPFETTDNYALISRGQVRLGEASRRSIKSGETELDSMFVIERRIYLKRAPITTTAYDKQTGAHIFTTTNLVHRDETPEGSSLTVAGLIADSSNPFWDVDEETGSHKVIEQVSEEWYYVSDIQNGEANERRVFIYLTPNQNDFVFYELIDRKNEKAEPTNLPEYGDLHPTFTDHKFVAAVPNDNTGDFYKYYYARDRFNEDQYNFSESFVDIGGVRVSLVRRSYVVLRSAYDPTAPVIGASMPSAPDNKFTGNYLLVDRVQRPIEDETLSSLYVSEERVYAKTPAVGSQEGNFTLQEGGLTITRTWIVPRDQVGAFPKPSIGSPDSEYGQYEYATRRVSQDTPPEIDSYFSVVLDIYAKKGWAFQEQHQYNIGYKIIETTTLEDDKSGEGNYSVAFDERGWQKQQRSAQLTGFDFDSKVETRPYGKITTTTSAGTQPIIGQNNTRSEIVYDDGTTQIYQRNVDTFTIKQGSSGQEKNEQIYASITTNKFYRTSGDVLTDTGSSRVIYDDGTVQVYEVGEEVVVAKEGGDAGQTKEEQIFATITTNSRFSTNSTINTETGNSRVVYRGGGVTIYQVNEETVVAKEGGNAGTTIRKTEAVTITTASTFNTTGAVTGATGSSRVVYRGGGVVVYQSDNETAVLSNTAAGTSIEKNNFATVTTNSVFNTTGTVTGDTGRSRVTYRGGGITVYQVDNESTVANTSGNAGITKRKTEAVTITTTSNFNTTGAVTGDTGSSRVVYRGGGVVVYQSDNEVAVLSNTAAGTSVEKNNFATVTTNSVFNTTGTVTGDTGRSRVTYRGGGITVYQVDNESTVANTSGNAGITKRKTEAVTITTTSNFNTTGAVSGDTGSSRVVYRGGGVVVYQSDNEVAVLSNTAAGTSVEKNNFATVTTNSVFNTTGVVTGDTGRSRVTYRGGGITVYQVDNESTVANLTGTAGTTIRKTEAVTITTASNFNTTGAVTGDTGSSRVVYRGGGVVVYQSDNETSVVSNSDAGTSVEKNNFATVTTTSTFSTASTIAGQTGRSRVTYRGGGITVYQVDSESTVANTSGIAGKTIRKTEAVTITTNSNFNTTGDVTGDTGSSRVVYRGGGVVVYQSDNETAVLSNTTAGTSIEKNNFATVTTNSVFNTTGTVTGDTGRSRVTYRGGGITVYQVDNESTVANTSGNAGITKRKTEAVTITTTSNFNTTGAVTGDTGSSRVVYRGGGVVVYQSDNEVAVLSNTAAGTSIEKNNFATVTTNSGFNTTGTVTGDTGRSRVTYRGGGITVYQVDNESTVANTSGNAGITKRKTEAVTITTTSNFNTTGAVTGDTGSSRVVYRGGGVVVYQSDNEVAVLSNTAAGTSVEKNNFATVTTTSVFNTSGVVTGGTGRSRVTYRGGGITVYQVDNESTVANTTGSAGTTIRKTEAVTITTASNFNTTGAVSGDTGSSRVVYRGGGVVVYQSDNETAVVSNTDAGTSVEKNNFATVTTNSVFNTTGTVTGDTGRSRVTYRGGGITVYQVDNESTVANLTGTAGTTIRKTEAVTITTASNFNTTGTVTGDTGSSRVVYRGGGVVVYQSDNEVAALSNSDAGQTVEQNNFAKITTTSTFNTSPTISGITGRSRVAYRGGGIIVYQVDSEDVTVNTGSAGTSIEKNQYATITTTSTYSESSSVSSTTGRSRVVYRGGGKVIYQVDNESVAANLLADAGTTREQNTYATVTTTSSYSTTGSFSGYGRSRVVYRGGDTVVYQTDSEDHAPLAGSAGATQESRPYGTITTSSTFAASGNLTGSGNGRSRVVYRGGGIVVYQVDTESFAISAQSAGQGEEAQLYGTTKTTSTFSSSPSVTFGKSRPIYQNGSNIVYQVDEEVFTEASVASSTSIQSTEWGTISTAISYGTSPVTPTGNGSSRPVFRGDKTTVVYENRDETPTIRVSSFVSDRSEDVYRTTETNTTFSTSPAAVASGSRSSSRAVYNTPTTTVYRNDVTTFTPKAGVTYETTVNYSWPRVLKSIEIDEYTYKDGSDKNWIPQVRWAKNSYSGPCRASITETWSLEPAAGTTTLTDFLVEDQIQYDTPYYKVNTGPCLHGAYDGSTTFIEIGNANVRYQPVKHTFDFPATTPADWPSSLVISNEQVQRGDGWVKRQVTVYPPITAATVGS